MQGLRVDWINKVHERGIVTNFVPQLIFRNRLSSQIYTEKHNQLFEMKGIYIISLLFLIALSTARLQIQAQSNPTLKLGHGYELSCVGANGHVDYEAIALPTGIALNGHTLEISDASRVKSGAFPIQIRATDSAGQSDSRVLVIIIENNSNQQINTSQSNIATAQTSTQARTQQNLQADPQLNQFLNTLDLDVNNVPSDYSQGYPVNNFPTGSTSDIPNYNLRNIATAQANPSAANRNQITAEDVRAQAIFQRQFNAAKALGNLISIIKQATANRNAAQEEVLVRTEELKLVTAQKLEVDLSIQDADNNYKRAQAGINTLNQQVSNTRIKLEEYEEELRQKKLERESTQKGLQRARNSLDNANKDLEDAKRELENVAADLADKEVQCQGLEDELIRAELDLAERPGQKLRLEQGLQTAKDKVEADKALVQTYKQQLAEAEAQLENSKEQVLDLEQKLNAFVAETSKLEARVNDLKARSDKCQEQLKKIQQQVNRIKDKVIPDIESVIFEIQQQIDDLVAKQNNLDRDLAELPNKIEDTRVNLDTLLERLQYLRGQALTLQRILRQAFIEGNDAAQAVAVAQQNLDAATARLEKEQKIVEEATINLEKARIEKEEADLTVQGYLRQGADILPFPAAPESLGVTEGEGSFQITGWGSFVSEAFGSIKPIFTGDLKTLYSWRFPDLEEEEAECAKGGLSSLSGYVLSVNGNQITLIDSNTDKVYQINIAGCTLNFANEENYSVQSGDIMVAKGSMNNSRLQATQTACIRR